jgi:hypothetical protein
VQAQKTDWTLDPTSTATPDAESVVAATGGGNWLLNDYAGGMAPVISVKAFGAKGDGITDDSAAFQAAFNACAGSTVGAGMGVFVPAGTFVIANPLNPPSFLTVYGSPGTTLLSTIVPGASNQNSIFAATPTPHGSTTLAAQANAGASTISIAAVAVVGGPIVAGSSIQVFEGPASPQSLRVATYKVKQVAGLGPFTITLDRPLLATWPNGAPVQLVTNVPQEIRVFGRGMLLKGTGWRAWEIVGAHRCLLSDVRIEGGAFVADYACSYDLGGYDNRFEDVIADGQSNCIGSIVLESQERGKIIRCRGVNSTQAGLLVEDCFNCSVIDCEAWGITAGSGLSIQTDGSNLGSLSTEVVGGSYYSNEYGIQVLQGSVDTEITGAVCQYNTGAGCYLSAAGAASSRTSLSDCSFTLNGGVGLLVDASVTGTVGSAIDLSGNTGSVNGTALTAGINTDVTLTGVVAKSLGNYGFIYGGTLTISGFEVQTAAANTFPFSNINTAGPAASRLRLTNGHIELDANGCAGVVLVTPGAGIATAYLSQVKIDGSGAGTSGVAVNTGTCARINPGCDFDGTGTPLNVSGSGTTSRNLSYIANGAAGVDVPFTDAKTTDRLVFAVKTPGGTPIGMPTYTITAGVKFTCAAGATDTSTYYVTVY